MSEMSWKTVRIREEAYNYLKELAKNQKKPLGSVASEVITERAKGELSNKALLSILIAELDEILRNPSLSAEAKVEKIEALLYTWIVANKLPVWEVQKIEGARLAVAEVVESGSRLILEARSQPVKTPDSLTLFVEECVEEAPDAQVSKEEFYAAYTAFCKENNLPTMSKWAVSRRLPQLCKAEAKLLKIKGKKTHIWKGIRLKGQKGKNLNKNRKT